MIRFALSLAALSIASAAHAADTYTVPLDPSRYMWVDMAINDVPLYATAHQAQIVEGGIEVCGTLHVYPGQEDFVMPRVAESRVILRVDWDDVFEMPADLSHFTRVDSAEATQTADATCRVFGPVPEIADAVPYHVFGNMFDF